MKCVSGAASLVGGFEDDGKANRDSIEQLKIELIELRRKYEKLEREFDDVKVSPLVRSAPLFPENESIWSVGHCGTM